MSKWRKTKKKRKEIIQMRKPNKTSAINNKLFGINVKLNTFK